MSLLFWVKKPPKEENPEITHAKELQAHVDELFEQSKIEHHKAEYNVGRIMYQLEENHLGMLMKRSLETRI